MISVVLIDDEMLVKVGLKSLIDWEKQGYRIVAEGENGEQGIALCKKYNPDLIITDIMMHPMDGIEMMKEIKKLNSTVKFIVLSGYDEFGLVKQALKLGALDYQLKLNTSEESLLELLNSIRPVFEENQKRGPSPTGDGNLNSGSLSVLQSDFLKNVIGNVFPGKEQIDCRKKELNVCLNEQKLYATVIDTDYHQIVKRYPPKDFKLFEFMVLEILREIGSEFFDGYFVGWSLGVFIMIFSVPPSEAAKDTGKKIADMSFVFQDALQEYFSFDFQVSTSGPCEGLENLHQAFGKIWNIASGGPKAAGPGLPPESADHTANPSLPSEPELCETLTRAFDVLDTDTVRNSFDHVFESIKNSDTFHIGSINAYCTRLVGFCDISLGTGFRDFCIESETDINELASLTERDSLLLWMKNYEGKILKYLNILMAHKNVLIENAKKYVQKNLSQHIVLNDVSDYLRISAGYLSSLFTKYEGIHFVDYVNHLKIEEAKKMLRTGNYKIYQIAYMLGYENSSYFSRIFKKVAGYAPKDLLC